MRITLILFTLLAFALPAQAASMLVSVEDRAATINTDLQGNNSYHAHLARELASIAESEKGEHDLGAAKEFIKLAEEAAAQAGGAK
ncbi:MAG: hypothetical protein R8K50_05785 [Mariprofundus sp.]